LYAEQHKVRMDGACESGTVTSDEVGGLVQQKVVYDGKLQKLEDVIQFFDSGKSGDLQVQKIRTYRMVPVDETIQAMGSNLGDGPSRAGSERSVRGKAYVEPMLPDTPKSGNLSAGGGSPSPPGRLTSGKHSSFSQSFTAGSGGVAELGAGLTMGMLGKKMVQIEVEETTAELGKRWIINPKHPKKIFWDLFIGALILWSVIIVPFRLGFDQEPAAGSTMEYVLNRPSPGQPRATSANHELTRPPSPPPFPFSPPPRPPPLQVPRHLPGPHVRRGHRALLPPGLPR
jgi:hypothetical protein